MCVAACRRCVAAQEPSKGSGVEIPADHVRRLERLIRNRSGIVRSHKMVCSAVVCSSWVMQAWALVGWGKPDATPPGDARRAGVGDTCPPRWLLSHRVQGFRNVSNSFLGCELVTWLVASCGFESRTEAVELAQVLLQVSVCRPSAAGPV